MYRSKNKTDVWSVLQVKNIPVVWFFLHQSHVVTSLQKGFPLGKLFFIVSKFNPQIDLFLQQRNYLPLTPDIRFYPSFFLLILLLYFILFDISLGKYKNIYTMKYYLFSQKLNVENVMLFLTYYLYHLSSPKF